MKIHCYKYSNKIVILKNESTISIQICGGSVGVKEKMLSIKGQYICIQLPSNTV